VNILSATIVQGPGGDHCMLTTDLPDACWPYRGQLIITFQAAYNTGAAYVKTHFGIDAEVIPRGAPLNTVASRHPQWDI